MVVEVAFLAWVHRRDHGWGPEIVVVGRRHEVVDGRDPARDFRVHVPGHPVRIHLVPFVTDVFP